MKGTLVIAVLFAACIPPPAGGPATCESGTAACGPQPVPPPAARTHRAIGEAQIEGFVIETRPVGVTGWKIGVKNNTDASVSIVWDESTFVTSNGTASGRLIRGETRKLDMSNAQPPTPVPAKATVLQVVFPEKLYDQEELEEKLATRDARTLNLEELERMRTERAKAIDGGRLSLVLDIGGQKQTWTGVVKTETPAP